MLGCVARAPQAGSLCHAARRSILSQRSFSGARLLKSRAPAGTRDASWKKLGTQESCCAGLPLGCPGRPPPASAATLLLNSSGPPNRHSERSRGIPEAHRTPIVAAHSNTMFAHRQARVLCTIERFAAPSIQRSFLGAARAGPFQELKSNGDQAPALLHRRARRPALLQKRQTQPFATNSRDKLSSRSFLEFHEIRKRLASKKLLIASR